MERVNQGYKENCSNKITGFKIDHRITQEREREAEREGEREKEGEREGGTEREGESIHQ